METQTLVGRDTRIRCLVMIPIVNSPGVTILLPSDLVPVLRRQVPIVCRPICMLL